MAEDTAPATRREQLEAAYEEHVETPSQPAEPKAPASSEPASAEPAKVEVKSEPEKPGRTAGRPRDEHGRLLPGKPVKTEADLQLEEGKKLAAQEQTPEPAKPRPPRPSSWKKDYWEDWDKLDPRLAEYLNQREGEFAKGVSTYKQEWERAKPLIDAVAPYLPDFQRFGIDPAQQVARYAEVHKSLALGTPQQKLATFLRMAQEYQVPVQELFLRGQDGNVYFNHQLMQEAQQHAQLQAQPPMNVEQTVAKILAQHQAREYAKQFAEAKDAAGNPAHPHYETVRETMAQLLEAGLAEDIPSAYEAAIRHPRHSDIFDTVQKQAREKDEAERQRKAKEEAERARRNTVSPKTATPSGATAGGAKKDRRAQLSEAWDEHVAGRV